MPSIVPFFTGAKQLTIDLAEPVIYLRGTAHDRSTQVLQGEVSVVLTKPTLASQVVIRFVGKSYMLWPEGIGSRGSKVYHEKIIHEQNVILQSFPENPKSEGVLDAGLHRWPFQFLISNQLVETIEDELGKVFYYLTATIHRVGVAATKLRARRDILLLRTPHWSDAALTANSLPSTSITSERRLDVCDASICIEKSSCSSGTQFPISISISPNIKHVCIESISVLLTEKRVYKLPEFQARRVELHDFKVTLSSVTSLIDPTLTHGIVSQLSLKEIHRALGVKNAHISLDDGPFQNRLIFTLPSCVHLSHDSTYSEIHISHTLKIHIELTSPAFDGQDTARTHIRLDTPITILDCRLKEDYNTLPTYEEAVLSPLIDEEDEPCKPSGFFICPCYLEYKKKSKCSKRDWMKLRSEQHETSDVYYHQYDNSTPPPSYEDIEYKR
ncbi:hypothetical protein BCV72DRAFT_233523 [Rhizopus microsporus var. microsporus]|uniref:Arrestin-like N-terminal domain-containing protein n=2 Tax=Rhizopus microsporus TaxID=58291 RepID=A0A2G4T062_RHIZD|nr:uncharacterized protein RHIMIDRAFT_275084 [Rhizopus microsporus ATCC 52813]ORE03147.1 hypothetical protein BCV72DRAFT_233523 [Rhizopus microsporus var. microsporus]PHZ14409.1 hypothetical protein RHIMIDRAFT_275084 [Rhizopus microsporus ATCC 52813]